jgi:putative PIG3 family NAD(P)H quinone oxidoreductase
LKYITVNAHQQCEFSQREIPAISANQCLIKVKAIGVNRADLLQKAGKYPPPPGESPILGLEVSGEIIEVGTAVSNYRIGQRVFGLVAGGGYAEYVVINAEHIIPLPDSFTFEQGAAIAEVFLTAYQALFAIGKLSEQERVFIHAGASGVGTAAIQLAKAVKAQVAVTVSSDEKAKICQQLGADCVINYRSADIVQEALAFNASGFDVIVDVTAGENINKDIQFAAKNGRIIVLAMLAGRFTQPIDMAAMLQKRLSIIASTLRNRSDEYKTQLIRNFSCQFMPLFEKKIIKPVIDRCFPWQQVEQAHQRMSLNQNSGKIILVVDEH